MEEQQPQQKKKTNYKFISIILAIILLCIGGAYGYQLIQEQAYEQGVVDTSLFLEQQIQTQLETQGFIIYNYPVNETNFQVIKLGVIQ